MSAEARKAFRAHARNARIRDIPFLFSFNEWWNWWQIDNRWEKRGNGKDGKNLVMARLNDTGPYAPANVYCTTMIGNVNDYWKNQEPSLTEMTCVRMDAWLRRALERVAEAEDRSLSYVILWILGEWIKANPEWMRPRKP